jgi:hypothetical protein
MSEGEKPSLVVNDPARAADLFNQFHIAYRQYIDDWSVRVEKASDINKQVSTFYERILFIDLGTLSLSVTAISTLASRISASVSVKHTFLWLVVPAWILLLFSTFACRHAMATILTLNRSIYDEWFNLTLTYNLQAVSRYLGQLAGVLNGTVRVADADVNFGELFKNFADMTQKIVSDDDKSKLKAAVEGAVAKGADLKFIGGGAVLSMQVALTLLGIAAVRLFLASPGGVVIEILDRFP